jgi:hypothetical protein
MQEGYWTGQCEVCSVLSLIHREQRKLTPDSFKKFRDRREYTVTAAGTLGPAYAFRNIYTPYTRARAHTHTHICGIVQVGVCEWRQRFKDGLEPLEDDPHSGRFSGWRNVVNVWQVQRLCALVVTIRQGWFNRKSERPLLVATPSSLHHLYLVHLIIVSALRSTRSERLIYLMALFQL